MPDQPSAPPTTAPHELSLGASWLIAIVSMFAIFLIFFVSQFVQMTNLPCGLVVTSLFVFGTAGLVWPAMLNLRPGRFTGATRFHAGLVALGFLAGLANMGFANFAMGALREVLPRGWSEMADQVTRTLASADTTSRIIITLAAGVAAPIGEELFFRGWLQGMFGRRAPRWLAIGVVAVMFSATHLDPVGFLPRVELGILFGVLRAWTGSIYPAMAAHAAHNLVSTLVLYLSDDPLAEIDQPFQWGPAAALGAGSLLLTIGMVLALHRLSPRSYMDEPETVEPLVPSVPTFKVVPKRALAFSGAAAALLAISSAVVVVFADRLPGGELTAHVRRRMLAPPPPPAPAERPIP